MMRRSTLRGRRNVLRGAGVLLALPWLESLAPRGAAAQAAGMPRRYLPITFPCGAAVDWWQGAPAFGQGKFGADFVLSPVHEPLQAVKSKLLVLSRIANNSWASEPYAGSIEPAQSRLPAAVGTCVDADALTTAAGLSLATSARNGVSADQVIAQAVGQYTFVPSLQLGLGTYPGQFTGRSWAYSQCYSWAAPDQPLKRHVDPKAVFAMLGGMVLDEEAKARLAEQRSVVDAVLEDASSLRPRLGKADQAAVDAYLEAFRELERRVVQPAVCGNLAEPAEVPEPAGALQGLNQGDMGYDRAAHAQVMNDLIAMAFQCDATRVISYLLDDARSEFDYSFIPEFDRVFGDPGEGLANYHGGCANGEGAIAQVPLEGGYPGTSNAAYPTVHRWWVRQVADIAGKLAAMPEGDGTVLDHTLMHLMSPMRCQDEDPWDLPMLLLGGTGFIKQDGHIALGARPNDRQLRDLYYTIQKQYFGLDVASFGDGPAPNALIEEILV